jgi:hypothetical protein
MLPRRAALSALLLMLIFAMPGCLGLVVSRELMEDLRNDPSHRNQEITVGWSYSFNLDDFSSAQYHNTTDIPIDNTVQEMILIFRAEFPYNFQNATGDMRYVDARLWEPGARDGGAQPFWQIRVTEDQPQIRERWQDKDVVFESGDWLLEVEAQGYGIDAPIDIASFHDTFDIYVTVIRPCVHFDEVHSPEECTDLVDMPTR